MSFFSLDVWSRGRCDFISSILLLIRIVVLHVEDRKWLPTEANRLLRCEILLKLQYQDNFLTKGDSSSHYFPIGFFCSKFADMNAGTSKLPEI